MTYILGLTGSIGMGKSTTAKFFSEEGVPTWDADATVRELYAPNGAVTDLVAALYPNVMEDGAVSRRKLRGLIAKDSGVLDHLQSIVHPLVAKNRIAFLERTISPIVLLDVPLLFETGLDKECDGTVVVSVPPDVQRSRVLARGEMTSEDYELILSRQMQDSEKRERATWVVETLTLDAARNSVKQILQEIQSGQNYA